MFAPGLSRLTRRPRRTALVVVALLATLLTLVAPPPLSPLTPTVAAAADGQSSRYIAFTPVRVLDTRDPGFGALQELDILSVDPLVPAVISAAGVDPLDVEAVAVVLTMTGTQAPGFLKSWATAEPTPPIESASAVNNRIANETIANFAIVPVGANGRISIQSRAGSHVVVDVQGVFERSTESRAGRFVPLSKPARAIDTRDTQPVPARTDLVVDLNATVGIPKSASAAVISLVATRTQQAGFLTAFPKGTVPKKGSNVNYPGGGYTIAGSTITQLDNGKLKIHATGTTDVIVDVIGYITGDSDVPGTSGLFVSIEPERHYDSRANKAPLGSTPLNNNFRTIPIAGKFSVPAAGVLGVASNLTMTATDGPGYLVIYPKNPRPQNYSTVNSVFVNHSIANHAIVALDNGGVSVYSKNRSDFVLDISGYFLDGTTPPPTRPRRTDTDPAPTPDVPQGLVPEPTRNNNYSYLQRASSNGKARYQYLSGTSRYYGWNPCDPITYAVNSERATNAQMEALNNAIYQVEEATGFDFQFIGEATGSLYISETFDSVDPRVANGTQAMALFGFSDPYATPILAGSTIGIGGLGEGIDSRSAIEYTAGDKYAWIVRDGFAIADVTDVTSATELEATFAHEIGHMVGLGHVPTSGELMRPVLSNQFTFGPGDKYGLWSIGTKSCADGGQLTREAAPGDVIGIDVTNWVAD